MKTETGPAQLVDAIPGRSRQQLPSVSIDHRDQIIAGVEDVVLIPAASTDDYDEGQGGPNNQRGEHTHARIVAASGSEAP